MSQTVIAETITSNACPDCGADITADERFVKWCPACSWNVDPAPARPLSASQQSAANASARSARELFDEVKATGAGRARAASSGASVAAALVHLLTALMLVTGVALLVLGSGIYAPVRFGFGAIAVLTAVYLQPFQPATRSRRKWAQPLTRDLAPILFGLIDDIAAELDAPGVDSVYFNTRYNASLVKRAKTGWTLTLGLAMWSVLNSEERVALIAHELGHQVNGDRRRSWLVRSAGDTMGRWGRLLAPRIDAPALRNAVRAVGTLASAAMLPFTLAARILARRLSIQASRQGQAAEYYADQLATRVAGTEAVHSLLEKSLLAGVYDIELKRAVRFRAPLSPWSELSKFDALVPEAERERHRRLGRLRLPAIDATHPPTQLRADVIAAAPEAQPSVALDGGRLEAIKREVEGIEEDATAVMRAALQGKDAFARPVLQS